MGTYQAILRSYVDGSSTTQAEFAGKIGRSQAAVNRYANGLRFPDADTAREIDRVTGGEVPFSAWQAEMSARMGFVPSDAGPEARAA